MTDAGYTADDYGLPTAGEPATPAASTPEPQSAGVIQTQSADGVTHEFPAGTSPAAVDKAMKTYAEQHRDKSTVAGQMATGFMDPIEGGGQLVSHALGIIPDA